MAANKTFSGSGAGDIQFGRPVGHLLVAVTTATIDISFDQGDTSITLPVGFHSFPVGNTKEITISGSGGWQIVGIQA